MPGHNRRRVVLFFLRRLGERASVVEYDEGPGEYPGPSRDYATVTVR